MDRKVNEWGFVPESFKSFNNCYDNDHKVETQCVGAGWCQSVNGVKPQKKCLWEIFFFFFLLSSEVRQSGLCVCRWFWQVTCLPLLTQLRPSHWLEINFHFWNQIHAHWWVSVQYKPFTQPHHFHWIMIIDSTSYFPWHIQPLCDVSVNSLNSHRHFLRCYDGGNAAV